MSKFIATDQYGNTLFCDNPRKELVAAFAGPVSKMYVDTKAGDTIHIGYVVGAHWFTVLGLEGHKFAKGV